MAERRTSRVACSVTNGIELRFTKPFADGTGAEMTVPSGESFVLRGPTPTEADMHGQTEIINDVDAEQFARWLEQNPGHPMVESGAVRLLDEDGPAAVED